MTKYIKWVGAWMLFVIPAAGFAVEDLSYNYIEALYVSAELDDFDEDADGLAFNASGLITERVFLFGGYSEVDVDFEFMGADVEGESKTKHLGVGLIGTMAEGTDVNATLSVIDNEIEGTGTFGPVSASENEDDTGYGVGLGVRHLFTPYLEGGASLNYTDLHGTSSTNFSLSGRVHFTPALSIGGSYTFDSDGDGYVVGGRLSF